MPGDFTLQDQRDGSLYVDGGMVTGPSGWSFPFNLGMEFIELHGPVPLAHELGVFERARQFLMRLQYGRPARRLNWSMTVNPRLDTVLETYPLWSGDRAGVTPANVGDKVHLRVELQTLFRLPRSNAILFGIRTYLASIADLARVPEWGRRMYRVLRLLHPELVEYKNLGPVLPPILDYLTPLDHS